MERKYVKDLQKWFDYFSRWTSHDGATNLARKYAAKLGAFMICLFVYKLDYGYENGRLSLSTQLVTGEFVIPTNHTTSQSWDLKLSQGASL
jgi:hypothetical protein